MGVPLPEGHQLEALRADLHTVYQGLGRQAIGKPLEREELVAERPVELFFPMLSHDKTGIGRRETLE